MDAKIAEMDAKIAKVEREVAEVEAQLPYVQPGDQGWLRLQEQLVALRQEKVLLVKQQVGAIGAKNLEDLRQQLQGFTMLVSVVLQVFDYTEDTASTSTVPEFKDQLRAAYSTEQSVVSSTGTIDLTYCMISHQYLPSRGVTASHLWKRRWAKTNFLELEDIHDWQNGLLLAKPLEWAFDTSRLSIIPFSNTPRSYQVYVMDPSIKDTPLLDKLKELQVLSAEELQIFESAWKKDGKQLTFGDMHGRKLESKGEEVPQPYRRVLCFQYGRALHKAREEGWLAPGVSPPEFDDYGGSPDAAWQSNVDRLFKSIEEV
uniref:HNH nuclease domain-containing protein n=1 Tax=Chlamydomonas chlamydogama TaxID=225041 RepID=A0A7S2QU54_9CHLO|mmetsp:Transcript_1966/g.4346  ORF Transcript_1966/g.4346 Transcript_1966/m.4346 type:complete len:315 (+) Transcript_1966:74-1018(+)